jgi:hypothetical protein
MLLLVVDMDLVLLPSGWSRNCLSTPSHYESVSLLEETLVVQGGGCSQDGIFVAARIVTPTGAVLVLLAVVIGLPL